ncbi:MAG: D-glycero-beta-D-manno-heptose-7-phosphate kinase, partial [Bdellovibrionales bacterium]|nr:D-glycero-beta-D-manno-heptose-7-phosphate kinase [Bdellovibrionales bacterium]
MNVTSVEAEQLKPAREKILAQLDRLNGRKVLVVGDLGLDQYVLGEVRRISPEAPVPVLEVKQEDR